MKIIPDELGQTAITGHGEGWIAVNGIRHASTFILTYTGYQEVRSIVNAQELTFEDFDHLSRLPVDILLLGTGLEQHFVQTDFLAPLILNNIGFECMDTAAACRTFNVLMHEGRKVGALLLLP